MKLKLPARRIRHQRRRRETETENLKSEMATFRFFCNLLLTSLSYNEFTNSQVIFFVHKIVNNS